MKSKNKNKEILNCPHCNGQDGIVGMFVYGMIVKQKFLYCDKCGYDVKENENDESKK